MKDNVKSIILPQTDMKKVHGHTRIVLTNPLSGHIIKDIESENTFQAQVMADLFDNIPFLNQQNNRSWDEMVGGLFLFKESVPANSRFMNAGNTMVGNGYRGGTNSSTPVELGSFNSIDSYARFENGKPKIYQVWDFNNNQGNGKISSVCLTSKIGGAIGYGNPSGSYRGTDWTLRSFSQDNTEWNETFDDDDTTYRFYCNTDGTVTVTEIKRIAVKGSVFSGLSNSYKVTPDVPFTGTIVASDVPSFNVGNHKIRFVPHGARTYAPNSSVPYYEFDTQDKTLVLKTFTNTWNRTLYTKASQIYYYAYCTFVFTRNNKVLCMSDSSDPNHYDVIVFDLSNSTNLPLIKSGVSFISLGNRVFYAGEMADDLYIIQQTDGSNWNRAYYIVDGVNETIYPCNSSTSSLGVANACNSKGLMACHRYGDNVVSSKYIFYNPLYLATINNLATPVVKDATMTMRVMYTLEEA